MIDQAITTVLARAGTRIVGINEHTRDVVVRTLQDGFDNGLSIAEITNNLRDASAFNTLRSETIARTETMFAYNTAALDSYGGYGVTEVQAIDGDEDEVCAARDGQTFPIDAAMDIEDHPNGTLDWVPVFGGEATGAAPTPTLEQASPSGDIAPQLPGAIGDFEAEYDTSVHTPESGSYYRIATGERLGQVEKATENWVQMDREYRGPDFGFTHSHPDDARTGRVTDGRSFSHGDVRIAIEGNIGVFRAVSSEWVHEITRPAGGWPKWDKVRKLAREQERRLAEDVDRQVMDAIAAGDRAAVDSIRASAEVELPHRTWQYLADEYGFPYTREARR